MTRHRRNPKDEAREAADLFGSIKSRIAQRENGEDCEAEGITVDLAPPATEPTADFSATGEPPVIPAPEPEPVSRLCRGDVLRGRYVIESQLGSGGMGTVYKALDRSRSEHTETDARVAIKVLHEQTRGRADVLSKLRREFYCAQALSHESVVKVYELDMDQDFPFFSMEFIDGENLPSVIRRYHPMTLPRDYVWSIIREVGSGLAHAHERRVIHGDMKPQNIMVTNRGEVRILDFGTAGESATALTPAYASCELLEGSEPDPRDDLFALACLSYELLAGEHPFNHLRSTEARTLKLTPRRPPALTGRQWKAILAGLAWDRAQRPRSVRDWLAELSLGSEPLGPIPRPEDAKRLSIMKGKGGMASALIALLAVVVTGGITWAMLSRPKSPPVAAVEAATDTETEETPVTTRLNLDNLVRETQADEPSPKAASAAPPKSAAKVRPAASTPARPVDNAEKIGFASAAYSIRPSQKFAEIRVIRLSGTKGTTSFQWRTEEGSAIAGIDFVPQAPTTTFFPAGVRKVSVFVKVIPSATRKRPQEFYVVLSNPSSGAVLGKTSKSVVTLHP
ncbi:MAG: protein kinase [Pseudomonadota bacterium]|nr:protein kinase [Pseudomonadota bacterium]